VPFDWNKPARVGQFSGAPARDGHSPDWLLERTGFEPPRPFICVVLFWMSDAAQASALELPRLPDPRPGPLVDYLSYGAGYREDEDLEAPVLTQQL
jgi:hypothetical protein